MAVQHAPDAPFRTNFGTGRPYTVGVEEELFLVDPLRHQISRVTDEVLARRGRFARGQVLGEMCDGVVELASPVCSRAGEAANRLRVLRGAALEPGSALLLRAGLHPTARVRGGAHRPTPPHAAPRRRDSATSPTGPRRTTRRSGATRAACCASRPIAASTCTWGCRIP